MSDTQLQQTGGFDLQAFLAEQRSEGSSDSEGHFTVSKEKALAKLAHYALPEAYSWVLKIVQAANLWHADNLEVVQSRVATSFFFCPQEQADLPTDTEIVGALQTGKLGDTPVGHLSMALCSLVEQAKLSFVLAVRRGDETEDPIYAGDDTSALDRVTREKWTQMSRVGIRLTVSHFRASESVIGRYIPTLGRVERRDIDILQCLEKSAFASHTSVRVDNRLVTSLSCSRLGMFEVIYRPLLSGRWREESTEFKTHPHSPFLDKHALAKLPLPPSTRGPHFLVCSLEWRVQRALATGEGPFAGLPYPPRHRIFWVRHGVIVAEKLFHNSTSGTTICLFLPAEGLRSDLTGLAVEPDSTEKLRVEEFLQALVDTSTMVGTSYLSGDLSELKVDLPPDWVAGASLNRSIEAAGFSVVTESLLSIVEYAQAMRDRALEALNELVQVPGAKEKLISQWKDFVKLDLRALEGDVERFQKVSF